MSTPRRSRKGLSPKSTTPRSSTSTPRIFPITPVPDPFSAERPPRYSDEYFAEDFARLNDEVFEIERQVDETVEDVRRVLMARLQAERDRVVNEARLVINEEKRRLKDGFLGGTTLRGRISFSLNPKFLAAVKQTELFISNNQNYLDAEPLFLASKVDLKIQRPISPGRKANEYPYSVYESMRTFAVIQGKDQLGCHIEKPNCVATLVPAGTNSCAIFSHNNNRLTIVASSGQLVATYMLCHDDKLPIFFKKIIHLVADDVGRVFLVEDGRLDTIFAFNPTQIESQQSLVVPAKFAHFAEFKKGQGRISGLAVCLTPGRLLYFATGLDIRAISLDDASERFRFKLTPSHQYATTVQCVQLPGIDWRLEGARTESFLVYTTWGGSELYRSPIFGRNGRLETHDKHCIAEDGPAPGNVHQIVAASCDLDGNVVVVEQGNKRLQVFSSAGRSLCTFAPTIAESISTCGMFEPAGVAIISSMQLDLTKHRRPVVVVADAGRDCVMLFAPKFR